MAGKPHRTKKETHKSDEKPRSYRCTYINKSRRKKFSPNWETPTLKKKYTRLITYQFSTS